MALADINGRAVFSTTPDFSLVPPVPDFDEPLDYPKFMFPTSMKPVEEPINLNDEPAKGKNFKKKEDAPVMDLNGIYDDLPF